MNAARRPLALRVDVDRGQHAVAGHAAQQPQPADAGARCRPPPRRGRRWSRRGTAGQRPRPRPIGVAPSRAARSRALSRRRPRRGSRRRTSRTRRPPGSGRPFMGRLLVEGREACPTCPPCPDPVTDPAHHAPFHRLSGRSHPSGSGRLGHRGSHRTACRGAPTPDDRPFRHRISEYRPVRAGTVLPGEGADWTPPSWDDVVREHADRVYRLAYRLTGNPHDAEDLTQETFIRVFRSLADYKPGTFEGWLHRITTNLFLDMARRRARGPDGGACPRTPTDCPAAGPSPSRSSPTPTSTRAAGGAGRAGARVPGRGRALRRRGPVVRGDRCHSGRETRYRAKQDPPGPGRAAGRAWSAAARGSGGRDEGRSGGRGMTGGRRFSLSSPDWGQAHLTLDAIVAYVDDELSPVAHARRGAPRAPAASAAPRSSPSVRPARPSAAPVARTCRRRCCTACGPSGEAG